MVTYIERFPSQAYLNFVNVNTNSAESQNLAVILPSNTNLSNQLFFSLRSSLVSATKHELVSILKYISFLFEKAENAISFFDQLEKKFSYLSGTSEDLEYLLYGCVSSLQIAIFKCSSAIVNSNPVSCISLIDAMTVLEDASIKEDEIRKTKKSEMPFRSKALTTYSTLARKLHIYLNHSSRQFFIAPKLERESYRPSLNNQKYQKRNKFRFTHLEQIFDNESDKRA